MAHKRNKKGFTLQETLIAVAVLVVLMAISFIAIGSISANLKMTELDAVAREIYVAAQNRVISLKATGETGLPVEGSESIANQPADFGDTGFAWEDYQPNYYYIVGGNGSTGDFSHFLPFGSIDETVRTGGCYIIEYNAVTETVYGVFYSDEVFDYSAVTGLSSREKSARKANDPKLGYYGGSDVALQLAMPTDKPTTRLVNDETLRLELDVAANTEYTIKITGKTSLAETAVIFRTGDNGVAIEPIISRLSPVDLEEQTLVYALTLDSLTGSMSFKNLSDDLGGETDYIPGEDIEVTVTAQYWKEVSTPTDSDTLTGNSLYASLTEGAAHIAFGRHLQNLEPTVSGVSDAATSAVQELPLDWGYYADASVATGLANGQFKSINNTLLKSYNGNGNAITNLQAAPNGMYCGLFTTVDESELKNITLVNEIVSSAQYSGGLAGQMKNSSAKNCIIYVTVDGVDEENVADHVAQYSVSGSQYVGGLVGQIKGGSISESLYAGGRVNLPNGGSGTCYIGGLVGRAENATIEKSFSNTDVESLANSWVYSGGFIGQASGTVSNCYCSGSISAANSVGALAYAGGFAEAYAGGFIGATETNNNISNCYCAMEYDSRGSLIIKIAPFCTFRSGWPSDSKCYYLKMNNSDATENRVGEPITYAELKKLTNELKESTSTPDGTDVTWTQATVANTKPYELKGSYYPFPRLISNDHYGDWILPDLEKAQLVYYEIYADNSLGIYNIDQLTYNNLSDDKTVVQDGYMLLLEKDTNNYSALGIAYDYLYRSNSIVAPGGKNLNGVNASPDKVKINGQPIDLTFNELVLEKNRESFISIHNRDYYPFFLDSERVVTDTEETLVSELSIKTSNGWGGGNGKQSIFFIPTFAKSKVSGESFTINSLYDEDRYLYIRTERHFATLATYNAANIRLWRDDKLKLRQERDLVFGEDNPYTTTYLGSNINDSYRNTIDGIGYVPNDGKPENGIAFNGVYDAGIYDDNGNLLAVDNSHSITGATVVVDGNIGTSYIGTSWYKGLFRYVNGGTVKNLSLNNVTLNKDKKYNCAFVGALMGYGVNAEVSNVKVSNAKIFGNHIIGGVAGKLKNSTLTNVTLADSQVTGYRAVGGITGQTELASGQTIIFNTVTATNCHITSGDLDPTTNTINFLNNNGVTSSDARYGTSAIIGNTNADGKSGTLSLINVTVSGSEVEINKTDQPFMAAGMIIGNFATASGNTLTVENVKVENSALTSVMTGVNTRYGMLFGKLSGTSMNVSLSGLDMSGNSITLSGDGGAEVGGLIGKAFCNGSVTTITLPNRETVLELPTMSFTDKYVSKLGGVIGFATKNVNFNYADDGKNGSLVIYEPDAQLLASGPVGGFAGEYDGGSDYLLGNMSVTLKSVESTTGSAGGFIGEKTDSPLNNISVTVSEYVKAGQNCGGLVSVTTAAVSNISVSLGGSVTATNGSAGGIAGSLKSVVGANVVIHGVTAKNNAGGVAGTATGSLSNVELGVLDANGVISTDSIAGGVAGSCQGQAVHVTADIGGDIKGYTKTGGFAGEMTSTLGANNCKVKITGTENGGVISQAGCASGFTTSIIGPSSDNELTLTGSVISKTGDTGGYAGSATGTHTAIFVNISGSVKTESGMAGGFGSNTDNINVGKLEDISVYIGGDVTGTGNTGGFAGKLNVATARCYTEVCGTIASTGDYLGGFVGLSLAKLTEAYIDNAEDNTGDKKTTVSALGTNTIAGGFAGKLNNGAVDCYAEDIIIIGEGGDMGGFTGQLGGKATDCYVKRLTVKNGGSGNTGGFVPIIESTSQIEYTTDNFDDKSVCPVSDCDISGNGEYTGGYAGKIEKSISYVRVDNTSVTGGKYVGGLAGYIGNVAITSCDVRLSDSVNTGEIKHKVTGDSHTEYVGGFAGMISGDNASISNSFAAINVEKGNYAGGFVGHFVGKSITACYATGAVTDGGNYAGGFAGYTQSDKFSGLISACYATGDVNGRCAGGFVGHIEKGVYYSCYSLGRVSGDVKGGFVGQSQYVQDFSKAQDVFAALAVLMKNGVKVTNRVGCGVTYLTNSEGGYVTNQLGNYVLDTSNCQSIFQFANKQFLDSGAEIIGETFLQRNPDGSVVGNSQDSKTQGTRVQNVFNKLQYYNNLKGALRAYSWTKPENTNNLVWSEVVINDPNTLSANGLEYASYTGPNVEAYLLNSDTGKFSEGTAQVVRNVNTDYLKTYKYNGLKPIGSSFTETSQVKDVTMIGVCFLTGDGYNSENMADENNSGVEPWSSTQFTGEVMGKTEYFTGFVAIDEGQSLPYSKGISAYCYPAARNIGSDGEENISRHWGNWPEIGGTAGYIAYFEQYDNGVGYYSSDGYGNEIINTLSQTDEITDYGCRYLQIIPEDASAPNEVIVSRGGATYSAEKTTEVSITFHTQGEDQVTYTENFAVYPLNPSDVSGFYTTVWIDGKQLQYNSHLAKAAVTGQRQGRPTGYIRNIHQFDSVRDFSGSSSNVLILETSLDNVQPIGDFSGSFYGGHHTLTSVEPMFNTLSGSVSNLNLNSDGGFASSNSGTISDCVVTGSFTDFGFAGSNSGTIQRCAAVGDVFGDTAFGFVEANNGTITQCYYSGNVTANVGSAAGFVNENTGEISNCFGTGTVTSNEKAGGFAAIGGNITNSYCVMALSAPECIPFADAAGENCWYLDCGRSSGGVQLPVPENSAGSCINDSPDFLSAFGEEPWISTYSITVTTTTSTTTTGYTKPEDFQGGSGWIATVNESGTTWSYTEDTVDSPEEITLPCFEAPAFSGAPESFNRWVFVTKQHTHEIAGDGLCADPLCDYTETQTRELIQDASTQEIILTEGEPVTDEPTLPENPPDQPPPEEIIIIGE